MDQEMFSIIQTINVRYLMIANCEFFIVAIIKFIMYCFIVCVASL